MVSLSLALYLLISLGRHFPHLTIYVKKNNMLSQCYTNNMGIGNKLVKYFKRELRLCCDEHLNIWVKVFTVLITRKSRSNCVYQV